MLRNKPRLKYCGLTVILSNPSRFDKLRLLTATGGVLFNSVLQPEFNIMQCDIRLADDDSPFIDGTTCILLLGTFAMHKYCSDTKNNTLNEMRGSPLYVNNIPTIASFLPQDAADIKNYEQELNTENKDTMPESEQDTFDDESNVDDQDIKTFSHTKRTNYAFWLRQDVSKIKQILYSANKCFDIEREPIYKIYPSADEVISELLKHKNEYLYFDIETDYEEQNILCFSFSFDGRTVYSVPCLDYTYRISYSSLPLIISALVVAIKDNILVAHNGANFDFFVLTSKYHIPIYRCYDTMLAQHRCYPDVEKSLGHCVSLWTNQRFHKDTDSKGYSSREQMMDKLKYCGKDVFTMFLVHKAIERFSKQIPGLKESIDCAMRSIRPYLICTLIGIRYSEERVKAICKENDELMMEYLNIIEILIGPTGMLSCKKAVKGKAKAFAGSNKQCCNYFHDQLGYPVVGRSSETGSPTLNKTCMYKLALKHDNPVIKFVLMYRIIQKEYSSLKFIPWKDDNGKIINYKQYIEKMASQ